jgi:formylmethanofuran dehydrogenase subunit E-like metal-binding protein
VEGSKNENIVASLIAYLESDNISESRLHFRTMVNEPPYEQFGAFLMRMHACRGSSAYLRLENYGAA